MSAVESNDKHKIIDCDEGNVKIVTPSISYTILKPNQIPTETPYQAGAFAAFYLTHLEYIDKEGKAPKGLVEKTRTSGYELLVLPN